MAGHPRIISVWCSPNRGFILTKVQHYNLVDSGVKTGRLAGGFWWFGHQKGIEMPIGCPPAILTSLHTLPSTRTNTEKLMNSGGSLHVSREKITQIGVAMAGKKKTQIWRARKSHDILGACSSYLVPKYPSKPATSTWKGVKMQRQSQWKSVRVVGWQISQN